MPPIGGGLGKPGEMMDEEKPEAIDIVAETQDFEVPKPVLSDEIKVGDKVGHTLLYISICRNATRDRAKVAIFEVIKVTPRSITCRPWGSSQKYGPQFERRYIKKIE